MIPEPIKFRRLAHALFDKKLSSGRELMSRASSLEAGQPDLFDGAGYNGDGAGAPTEAQGPEGLNG